MSKGKIVQVCAIDATMDKLLRELNALSIESGYEVTGVCSYGNSTKRLFEEGLNIESINIDRRIRPISNIQSIYKMYKLFKTIKPDIVHVHTPVAAVLGRIAAKLARISNIIYTAHGFYFHENMKPFAYKLTLLIEKVMAKFFTDFIFTQSEEDAKTAVDNKFLDEKKILTIGNGIDVWDKFNPNNINQDAVKKLRKEFEIKDCDKVITFVGRLVKEKGILELLKAFEILKVNNVKLIVVGDIFQGDRDFETIKMIEYYKKNNKIIFTGARNDISNILYLTDIFCLPSYREGMPRSIIESMAMECAVVATNIRGSREEVIDGKTGFLTELKSPEDIKIKIEMILNNEELLTTMKKNGRKRAEKLYDEKKVVELQLDIYEKLMSKDLL